MAYLRASVVLCTPTVDTVKLLGQTATQIVLLPERRARPTCLHRSGWTSKMARRRSQNISPALLGTVIVLGIIGWALKKATELWQALTPVSAVAVGLVVAAPVILFIFVRLRRSMQKKADQQAMLRAAAAITDEHLQTLLKRRIQLLRYDSYGKQQAEGWLKELNYFINSQIAPTLAEGEQQALRIGHEALLLTIAERVEQAAATTSAFANFSVRMTPSEFEAYCAEELRRVGWHAYVTRGSRDQGIDVVATKDGRKLILQCKLYTAPVGNKAVQEAYAGKAFEGAQYAAVVSNSPYTPSAQQLAATNGVILLHYSELAKVDGILGHRLLT
jgi:restriction system protein